MRVALLATGLQIVDGFWLLMALPQGVMLGLMRSGAGAMIPLGLGILFGLGALMVLSLSFEPMAKPRLKNEPRPLGLGIVRIAYRRVRR